MRDENAVPEGAIDYDAVFLRGGRNFGDEDFALFKCPLCGRIYLIDYEIDTVYVDANDLSQRALAIDSMTCVGCHRQIPEYEAWIGPNQGAGFRVTWRELKSSPWAWVARC